MKHDFLKDMIKYLPSQIVPGLIGFIIIPIITRLFSPAEYGNYVLVVTTISLLATISGWLGMAVLRFYPMFDQNKQLDQFYSNIIVLLLLTTTILSVFFYFGITLIFEKLINSTTYQYMKVGILVFVLTSIFETLLCFLQAKRLSGWYSVFTVWKNIAWVGIGLGLVKIFNLGIEGLLWGSILSMGLALPLLWILAITHRSKIFNISIDLTLTKEMVKYSFPLVVGNLAAWLLNLSDRYILEYFRGSYEVGIYSVSYVIAEKSITLIASLFHIIAVPLAVNTWEKYGEQKTKELATFIMQLYLVFCFPIVVVLIVLSRPVVDFFVEADYREGYRIIPIIALSGFLYGLQQRFQLGLIFYKKTKFIMLAIVMGAVANILLNMLLVPRYGYVAAAVTTLIGYAIIVLMMVIFSRKYFTWELPYRSIVNVSISSSIMAFTMQFLNNSVHLPVTISLFTISGVGILVYFLALTLLGEMQFIKKKGLAKSIISSIRSTATK